MAFQTSIRAAIGVASSVVGPLTLALQRRRDAAAIFLYHRVGPGSDRAYPSLPCETFIAHCEFMRRHFRILPLGELLERARTNRSLKGCSAICFDDGYRDFIDYAYPVLRQFEFPVTHFLVTDCIDTNVPPWTYRINRLASHQHLNRRDATKTVESMPRGDRDAWLSAREVGTPMPPMPSMITAADFASFNPDAVEWGSHTASHAFLDRMPESDVAEELRHSKERLEKLVGRPVRYLAYPNGYYNQRIAELSRAAGYEAALTVGQAELSHAAPMYAVPRFDVGNMPASMLALEVTGVVERLRRLQAP